LNEFTNLELNQLLHTFDVKDFDELYYLSEFDSKVRLAFQVEREFLHRLKKKSVHKNLPVEEKATYYKMLYHFRLVESFFQSHYVTPVERYSLDYLHIFYSLWYSSPGLEVPTDVTYHIGQQGKILVKKIIGCLKKYL